MCVFVCASTVFSFQQKKINIYGHAVLFGKFFMKIIPSSALDMFKHCNLYVQTLISTINHPLFLLHPAEHTHIFSPLADVVKQITKILLDSKRKKNEKLCGWMKVSLFSIFPFFFTSIFIIVRKFSQTNFRWNTYFPIFFSALRIL